MFIFKQLKEIVSYVFYKDKCPYSINQNKYCIFTLVHYITLIILIKEIIFFLSKA